MSEIIKKIYKQNDSSTQVYPETHANAVVGLADAIAGTASTDYNTLAKLEAAVKAITPKKAVFSYPTKYMDGATEKSVIKDIKIYKYAENSEQVDPEPTKNYNAETSVVYARDGVYGYPCIDGTGQVSFSLDYNDTSKVYKIVPTVTGTYKNFKTEYLTCINGVYRFTKVTSDLSISLACVEETAGLTAAITLPTSVKTYFTETEIAAAQSGDAAYGKTTSDVKSEQQIVIKEYRTEEAALANYKPTTITTSGYVYSKETGYKCTADDKDSDNKCVGQVHYIISNIPDGYKLTIKETSKNFKKCEINGEETVIKETEAEIESGARIKLTQVSGNLAFVFALTAKVIHGEI